MTMEGNEDHLNILERRSTYMNSYMIHNSFLGEQLVTLFEGFPHHDISVEAMLDSDCIFVVTAIGQPHMLQGGFYAMFEKRHD